MRSKNRFINFFFGLLSLSLFTLNSFTFSQIPQNAIFKEFTYSKTNQFSEIDPESARLNDPDFEMYGKETQVPRKINVDLEGAIKAEMAVEFWGGHIGTSEQKFRVNGNDWIYLPQPQNTPEVPNCYYRTLLGNETIEIPLNQLVDGENVVQFTAGPQLCNSFDWGFYWIYTFTIRVYYDDNIIHPEGEIISHAKSDTIHDSETFTISVSREVEGIQKVDLIGYYEDFDWEGNGIYEQWHYQLNYGEMNKHIGSSANPPYTIQWNSEWIPDQKKPIKIMAIIRDSSGINYSTSMADSLFFSRPNRHVKMYKPLDVPTNFGSRMGRKRSCKIEVKDDLTNATKAKFMVSSWSGFTHDNVRHEVQLNNLPFATDIGRYHNYSFDYVDIPVSCFRNTLTDTNKFTVYSEYDGHSFEINWPGPVLFIEYINDSVSQKTNTPRAPGNLKVNLVNERLAKLSWEHVSDHLGYVIERKRTSFDYQVLTTIKPNLSQYQDKTLFYTSDDDTVAYSYRIYAYNCEGNSSYSNEAFLYNNNLTSGNPEIITQNINIYPNPADDFFTIQLNDEIAGTGQVKIYDMTGRLVKTIEIKKLYNKGGQKVLSVNSLQEGLYILTVSINGKTENKKIIVK